MKEDIPTFRVESLTLDRAKNTLNKVADNLENPYDKDDYNEVGEWHGFETAREQVREFWKLSEYDT